jgi:hypothetical protein
MADRCLTGQSYPAFAALRYNRIEHKLWAKGGCAATIATSVGAHLRYQLDRDSQAYKDVYKQRTATERINQPGRRTWHTCTGTNRR